MSIRPVETHDDWSVVRWLWQAFRHDLSFVTGGLPRATGRYSTKGLDIAEGNPDFAGYVWWTENEHGDAPGGFALVDGLLAKRRTMNAFWVAPSLRGTGVSRELALDAITRHPGPWTIAFQHDNTTGGAFWRRVSDAAFGVGGWTETERPVPHKPDVPPDHFIETA